MNSDTHKIKVTTLGASVQMTPKLAKINEQTFRGIQQDYSIEYTDGSIMKVEFIKPNHNE